MQSKWTMISALLFASLTVASCGGNKKPKKPAPAAKNQTAATETSSSSPAPSQNDQGSTEQNQNQNETSQPGSSLADPNRTDFKVNKSCDASKIKPSESLPVEIKIKACLHLRTDSSEANAVTKRCGKAEDNIKEGNICKSRKNVTGMCRLIGKEYVLDYYPTDNSDWEQFCELVGGEAIEI